MGTKGILTLFGMFDRLDDIVYEPVHLLCDALRQPLRQIEINNERKKMELESSLEQNNKAFEEKLKLEINRENMLLRTDERKINAQIDKMLDDADFERQERMVEAIKRYQIDLGEVSVSIGDSIGKMSLELRKKAQDMVLEQTLKYKEIQEQAMDDSMKRLEMVQEKFGFENSSNAKKIMEHAIEKQMIGIIERADEFMVSMKNDLETMVENIDIITRDTAKSSSSWISVATTKALTSGRSDVIEKK